MMLLSRKTFWILILCLSVPWGAKDVSAKPPAAERKTSVRTTTAEIFSNLGELPFEVTTEVTLLRGLDKKKESTRYRVTYSGLSHSTGKGSFNVRTAHNLSRGQVEAVRLSYSAYLSLLLAGSMIREPSTSELQQSDGNTIFIFEPSHSDSNCPKFKVVKGPLGAQPTIDRMCSWRIKVAKTAENGFSERLQFFLGGLPVSIGRRDEKVIEYSLEATFRKVLLQGNRVPCAVISSMSAHVMTTTSRIAIENQYTIPAS